MTPIELSVFGSIIVFIIAALFYTFDRIVAHIEETHAKFIPCRNHISGSKPSKHEISYDGEIFVNTADKKMWIATNGELFEYDLTAIPLNWR